MPLDNAAETGIFQLTHDAELEFPHLFEPRQYKGKGDAKYDAMFVFDADHTDMAAIKALVGRVARAKWPGVDFKDVTFPVKLGDKVADKNAERNNDFLRGKLVITARSVYPPKLCVNMPGRGFVDFREADRDLPACKSAFYRGVRVLAEFNFVPQLVDERYYITAYLNSVGSLNKGERRGGGRSGNETFAGYVGRVVADDPAAGMPKSEDAIVW